MINSCENKRKAPRFDCYVPVDGKEGAVFSNTKTVDISRDGIGFLSNHSVPLNERIAIELALKPDTEPVLVIGQVKWVRKVADSNQYRIGLTFSDIIDGSKDFLDESLSKRFPSRDKA
ncbi:MAG: PilZ domain-containing protein [Candidatus Omnitrophica bacterium]|nr:PilZ domain-containing protein [Candidatus Omnitrophota bacterium]